MSAPPVLRCIPVRLCGTGVVNGIVARLALGAHYYCTAAAAAVDVVAAISGGFTNCSN